MRTRRFRFYFVCTHSTFETGIKPKLRKRQKSYANRHNGVILLTPDDVGDGADEQVGAALLHAAAVRIVVHVAHGLPGAEPAQYEVLAVGVDHVDEPGVGRVQPGARVLVLEQRPGRVQARDPAQVLELSARVAGRVRAQAEPDQVHVLHGQPGLGRQAGDQHGHLFAH